MDTPTKPKRMSIEEYKGGLTHSDVPVIAKAIYDEVRASLEARIKELEGSIYILEKTLESKQNVMLGKFEEKVLSLQKAYTGSMKELRSILEVIHTPNIVVNVPELRSPEIKINVPTAKPIRKTIIYDEFNRPSTILQQEEENKE